MTTEADQPLWLTIARQENPDRPPRHAESDEHERDPRGIGLVCRYCHGRWARYEDDFYGPLCKICYWAKVMFATANPWTGEPLRAQPSCQSRSRYGTLCQGDRNHIGQHFGTFTTPDALTGQPVIDRWPNRRDTAVHPSIARMLT